MVGWVTPKRLHRCVFTSISWKTFESAQQSRSEEHFVSGIKCWVSFDQRNAFSNQVLYLVPNLWVCLQWWSQSKKLFTSGKIMLVNFSSTPIWTNIWCKTFESEFTGIFKGRNSLCLQKQCWLCFNEQLTTSYDNHKSHYRCSHFLTYLWNLILRCRAVSVLRTCSEVWYLMLVLKQAANLKALLNESV